MERYIVDGQPYDVAPHRLDDFLKIHGDTAVKAVQEEEVVEKPIDVVEEDAPVTSEIDMASSLDDISSASGFERHGFLKDKDAEGNVIGYSLFEKKSSDIVKALEEYYPNFDFRTSNYGFRVIAPDGTESVEIADDLGPKVIGGLFGAKTAFGVNEETGEFDPTIRVSENDPARLFKRQQDAFNALTSFIDNKSTEEDLQAYQEKVKSDVEKYKLFSVELEESIDKQGIENKYLIDNPNFDFNKPESKDNPRKITNRDIFKSYDVTETSTGILSGIGGVETTKTITPYEKELANARKVLGEGASEKDAQDFVVQNLIKNEIIAEREKIADSIIEESESYQFLLDRGAKEFATQYAPKIKLYDVLRTQLTEGDALKRLREIRGMIDNPDYNFEIKENENVLFLADGRAVPSRIIEEHDKLQSEYNISVSHFNSLQKDISDNISALEDVSLKMDLLRRNYDGVQKFFEMTGLRTIELLDNMQYGTKMLLTSGNPSFTLFNYDAYTNYDKRKKIYDEIRNQFEKDVKFDDAFSSLENFGTFVAQEVANQLPIFAALAMPGGSGLYVIGSAGFGEQYRNMTSQNLDPNIRAGYSEAEKFFASLGYGSAEVVFGSLPTYYLLRGVTRSSAGAAMIRDRMKQWNVQQFQTGVASTGAESIGEGLTVITQNAINGIDLMTNVDHAMFSGALFGTTFASVPIIKGQVLRYYSTADQFRSIDVKNAEIKQLEELNLSLVPKTSRATLGLFTAETNLVNKNKERIVELQKEVAEEVAAIESKVVNTYGQVAEQFVDAQNKLSEIRLEYENIYNSDVNNKEVILKQLEADYFSLESGLRKFKKSKDFDNQWALYSSKRKNKSEVKRIKDLAKQQLEQESVNIGKFGEEINIDPSKIENRARLIYNTEQIQADIKLNKSRGTNLSKTLVDFNTVDEAVQYLNNLAEAKIEQNPDNAEAINAKRDADIQTLQNGGHGLNLQTLQGRKSLVVIDNMAKDDRLEIRTHELKHQVFVDILGSDIGTNVDTYQDMADQVMKWLEVNNKAAFNRVNSFAERDANGNLLSYEVLAVFFEEVAAGRVNLNNDSRFAGLLGYFIRDGAKKKGMNIDLAGEQDAVKFLIGLATKIKQGALTIKDTQTAKKRLQEDFANRNFPDTKLQEKSTLKSSRNQQGVFKDSNDALIEGLQMLGLENADLFALDAEGLTNIRETQPEVFNKMVKDWNNLGDSRLWLGSSLGPVWRTFSEVNYLSKRDKATNYDLLKSDILDVLTTGVQPGDNGIPYIVRSWLDESMASGNIRSLNSHIFGLINTRLMAKDGIIDRKFPRLGMKTVALDAETETGRVVEIESDQDIDAILAREKQKQTLLEQATEYNSRKAIGIDDNFAAEIENVVEEILIESDITDISKFEFTQKFKNKVENALYKKIKSMMGKGVKGRERFLRKYKNDIMRIVNTATLVQFEKNETNKIFAELVSTNQGPEVIKQAINDGLIQPFEVQNLEAGNNIYRKKTNVNEDQFVEFFSKRGRENALAKALAFNVSRDAVFPVVNKNDKVKKAIGGEAGIKALKARINTDQDVTLFSQRIANLSFGNQKILAGGLDQLVSRIQAGVNFDEAFDIVYRKDYKFEGQRKGVKQDLSRILGDYDNVIVIKKSQGILDETTLLDYFNEQTQPAAEFASTSAKAIFDLEKRMGDMGNKDQLISSRLAFLELVKVLGRSKANRFLRGLTSPSQIGSTDFVAVGPDVFKIGLTQRIKIGIEEKIAKIVSKPVNQRTKKEKNRLKKLNKDLEKYNTRIAEKVTKLQQRYGLFDSTSDFDNNFLSNEDVAQDNVVFPEANQQTVGPYLRNKNNLDYNDISSKAKAEQDFLLEFSDILIKLIKDPQSRVSKNDAAIIVMSMANGGMNTPIARAAPVRYVPAQDITTLNVNDYRYEHTIPRKIIAAYMAAYINGKVSKKDFKKLLDNYHVAIIPKTTDKGLKNSGLESSMQAGWSLDNINDMNRYANNKTLGFWDTALFDLKTKTVEPKTFEWARVNSALKFESEQEFNYNILYSQISLNARSTTLKSARGMSTFDFDETLIIDGENFIVARKGDEEIKISSGRWPIDGPVLADQGYNFDFSDFVNVRGGVNGPLLTKFKNRLDKFGPENMYVLTARPQQSAEAIHGWLKSKGLTIPLANITGLGNSTGEAKAEWMLKKFEEGYNDMYFVDDALPNVEAVKNVLDQLDIKSDVQQAITLKSERISVEFNKMLERTKGVGEFKTFSRVEAMKRGKNVGGFKLFVPPSAEDFTGLLRYFAGTGAQGDADIKFFEENLVKPFARADREMAEMKQKIRDEYKAINKQFPDVKKKLGKLTTLKGFTLDNAIRVYLFDKAGYEIPGLSKSAKAKLVNIVKSDPQALAYAESVSRITKQKEGYIAPDEYWNVGNIAQDLQDVVNKVSRKQFLAEWKNNTEVIFSETNLNKIEAVYGSDFRSALEDILYRMESGQNRRRGATKFENQWNNWINNSVGAIMFFNARSAVLQTMSTVNFINFEDNNIFAASRAFANQKQYWSDFSFLFNSSFLRNRRAGLATNINEAELASAVVGAKNKAKAALGYLLKIGFTPTQIADSFAIAAGGATFYRNRIKRYVDSGLSQVEAEKQAMLDFQEIAEETQQSARPDRISQQQASNLGRIILAFANTPMQYNRLIKKAAGDLINRRGDWRANMSRIIYYGAVQNFIFASLQNALFAMAFDEEGDEDKEEVKQTRVLNSMLDSLLRGSGIGGAALATVKNAILEYMEQSEKGGRADYNEVVLEALQVSPPLGSKARKLSSAGKTIKYNKEVIKHMDLLDYDNPVWTAVGNTVEATTNIPMARAIRKIDNLREAMNQDNTNMQRLFLSLGWSSWDLNVGERVIRNPGRQNEYVIFLDKKRKAIQDAKDEIKQEKKEEKARQREEKKKNQQRCTAIKSDGERCKMMVDKPKKRCHYHD